MYEPNNDSNVIPVICSESVTGGLVYLIFFQAEDGIRDIGVTGVQTCALPILRYGNQLPEQIEGLIVRLKAEKPHWGARKIRELLVRRLDGDIRVPAKSTIHAVLDQIGRASCRERV